MQTYLIPEIYAEDYQSHFICGLETTGQEGVLEFISGHRQAFPDWTEKVVDIVAEGDRVVTRYISTGTHEDEFQDCGDRAKDNYFRSLNPPGPEWENS